MSTPEDISILVEEALRLFGIKATEHHLIRHNENITCKIPDGKDVYCLHIHRPVDGFNIGLLFGNHSAKEYMQGEIDLLSYMRGHGFTPLQEPIAGPDGRYVYSLSDGSPAMLLRWVEGETIAKDEGARYAYDIGRMATKIHQASKGFTGIRLMYDEALIDAMAKEIDAAIEQKHLIESEGNICKEELSTVKNTIRRLSANPEQCGIIHADLSFGNILITENGLVPIDFSLSGFGCHAQEAGMIQSNYQNDGDSEAVTDGFRSGGEQVSDADAEIFLSMSVLLFISAQHAKCHAEPWFAEAMERWCGTVFTHRSCSS